MRRNRQIEALAEAIIASSGYLDPTSALYAARNPGGLKAFASSHRQDEHGNRVFGSVLDGLQAILHDVEVKLDGKAFCKLKLTDTLEDLARAYDGSTARAGVWAKFLRKALRDERITAKTELKFFTE